LIYVGYGDEFPIANQIHLTGIRANSRIQIVATLPSHVIHWNEAKRRFKPFANIGAGSVANSNALPPSQDYSHYAYAFSDDHTPSGTTLNATGNARGGDPVPYTEYATPAARMTADKEGVTEQYNAIIGTEPAPHTMMAYNNAASAPQTFADVKAEKQRGFKGEDLKDEGASFGNSPR
jgi:hypothetical protein